jgi:hypothetical protein
MALGNERKKAHLFYGMHQTNLCNTTGQFSKPEAYPKEVINYADGLNPIQKTILYINIAIAHFGNENYHECLKWLNKIIPFTKEKIRSVIERVAKIIFLIAHYEIGNNALLPYLVKSNHRFLLKQKPLFKIETIIVEFLSKVISKIGPLDKRNIRQTFTNLK